MQRLLLTTITLIGLAATILMGSNLLSIDRLIQRATASQLTTKDRSIVLKLTQSKRVINRAGYKLIPVTKTSPGDTIVYSITASNISNRPIDNFVINQKIPPGTSYVLYSATPVTGATLDFSIDNGKSYNIDPIFNNKPALSAKYTNLRWTFTSRILPKAQNSLSYEIRIR